MKFDIHVCPYCGSSSGGKIKCVIYDEDIGKGQGMFDDGPVLYEYTLKNGKKLKEVVQYSPWSSGPCIFLCLQNERGKKIFKWSKKAINSYL